LLIIVWYTTVKFDGLTHLQVGNFQHDTQPNGGAGAFIPVNSHGETVWRTASTFDQTTHHGRERMISTGRLPRLSMQGSRWYMPNLMEIWEQLSIKDTVKTFGLLFVDMVCLVVLACIQNGLSHKTRGGSQFVAAGTVRLPIYCWRNKFATTFGHRVTCRMWLEGSNSAPRDRS